MSNGDLLDVRVPMPSESGAKVETELSLTDLLQEMTRSCTQSAKQLNDQMQPPQWPEEVPYVYTIPQMSLELRLQLSQKEGMIKSLFGSTTETSSLSTIKLDLVAVPRNLPK
jgi:hypothetical protein